MFSSSALLHIIVVDVVVDIVVVVNIVVYDIVIVHFAASGTNVSMIFFYSY